MILIGSDIEIKHYSLVKNSIIYDNSIIGPYARLRSGTEIGDCSQIGSFVEIKNSIIGKSCKINHMAFIGDADIEDNVIIELEQLLAIMMEMMLKRQLYVLGHILDLMLI